ncbi:hypothetical protein U3B98_004556 [Klebsiella pneumoniae]|uniref:HEPN domain-containing protein n=1 Tax=Klebsiella variicola TaxID=244366 RepID=UPI001159B3CA|nr:HEPN domain-containing protein [Klebsiella variicola]EMA4563281.1 hypothetical protein [Klebsiella pneumoniae]EMB2199921.1 hypothetical protein [Klebsiella pneumoniae]HBR4968567.1 hypothetical protein [Klebsiella pneumoniae]
MHPGKANNLRSKILDLLDYIHIDESRMITFSNPIKSFEKLENELRKKSDVFDTFTTVLAYIDAIYYYCNHISPSINKDLSLISKEEKQKIVDFTLSYLITIPFDYKSTIELTSISLPEYVQEESKVSIKRRKHFGSNATIIEIKCSGYYTHQNSESFIKEPLKVLNCLLYFMLVTKIIKHTPQSLISAGLGGNTIQNYTSINVFIRPESFEKISHHQHLPLHISKFLSELKMTDNYDQNSKPGRAEIAIESALALINAKTEGAEYIRSAIDWYMNSLYTTDSTMSFIQTCMGLEALLGEKENGAGGLTRTLADRCAYLIGNGHEERVIIKQNIEDIYKLRSNIVHGVTNTIRNSEKKHTALATIYLNKVISSECRFVK